jgi:hypothetical protein
MNDEGLFDTLLSDGQSLFKLIALGLIGASIFVVFRPRPDASSATPPISAWTRNNSVRCGCRIGAAQIHDRISFGGVLLAIGVMYLWLAEFPLRRGGRGRGGRSPRAAARGSQPRVPRLRLSRHVARRGDARPRPLYLFALWRTRRVAPDQSRADEARLPYARGRGHALLWHRPSASRGGLVITTVGMTTVFVPRTSSSWT